MIIDVCCTGSAFGVLFTPSSELTHRAGNASSYTPSVSERAGSACVGRIPPQRPSPHPSSHVLPSRCRHKQWLCPGPDVGHCVQPDACASRSAYHKIKERVPCSTDGSVLQSEYREGSALHVSLPILTINGYGGARKGMQTRILILISFCL